MQFLIGSLATFVALFFMAKILRPTSQSKPNLFKYSQSSIYEVIKPALPIMEILNKLKQPTQSKLFEKSMTVKVLVVDNRAYWIKDNAVYSADIVGETIKKETAKVVDMMGMDDVELDRMMFIIGKLTEGNEDDSGNSGYPKL